MEIKITLSQLESLLIQQKKITIKQCMSHNYYYNKESTEGHSKSLPIDEEKFQSHGMKADFPEDFKTLKKYIKE